MRVRSVPELISYAEGAGRVKYVRFWGHQPRQDGSVGHGCFSQWWPAPFQVDGLNFATAEHYMMWGKAMLFGDTDTADRVVAARHPKQAKELGRQVRGFNDIIWAAQRFDIVVAGSVAKFGQHEQLKQYLLGTGDRVLVEASPVDRIWGIGLAADDPRAENPAHWRGLNLLGFALMAARDELRVAQPELTE
ncbi:NADAR family protein [Nocardia sp. CWNU-33]|uniref:NADAR family protein n=1 Tax=Nocardia sp. CWNU-33 TaxID=3392117 RepID=UPI00398F7C97